MYYWLWINHVSCCPPDTKFHSFGKYQSGPFLWRRLFSMCWLIATLYHVERSLYHTALPHHLPGDLEKERLTRILRPFQAAQQSKDAAVITNPSEIEHGDKLWTWMMSSSFSRGEFARTLIKLRNANPTIIQFDSRVEKFFLQSGADKVWDNESALK